MPLYKPDHIFLDVNIPGMGGVAMMLEPKKGPALTAIPVALVSGKEQKADKMWGQKQAQMDISPSPSRQTRLSSNLRKIQSMSTLAQPVDADALLDQVDPEFAARGEQDNVAARLVQRLGVMVAGSAMAIADSCHQ